MTGHINQNPEQRARDKIDALLQAAGWSVQSFRSINFSLSRGVAVTEYPTGVGPADYVLFVDKKPVGVIEAKREEEGQRMTVHEEQSRDYAHAKLKYLNNEPLSFAYESTGVITRFTDFRDPKPRAREVFAFHTPDTLAEWLKQPKSLRSRLQDLPGLDPEGLRPAQIRAIERLEQSFKNNRPRALIQMATGAGKTFTATTFVYRLLKFAKAKRVLFLVDTRNLGEQAEQAFRGYQPQDDNRMFTELYNVQRLNSGFIAGDSQVCISTIQRLYSILKGEELDESAEQENPNESSWVQDQLAEKAAVPVEYTPKVPIEQFDFIVIDECHRSIYNLWKQVLDYFDAFLIGLTATPDKRTFGFFNENVVSEYTYEESVTDGVNVPYDVYTIETEISNKGAVIESGWYLDRRDKLTRKKQWQQEDEDIHYRKNDLDKGVVNISQIRNIIREFKRVLQTQLFPERIDEDGEYEVPKTLIFAKTDSHADDIINMVREEFEAGNEFCKKVTYRSEEDPKSLLNRFRNDYYPRIAVTVDMIATGTDVKPLEVLLFMRDVRSVNYFEQMKGRGTRTIDSESLRQVSRTAQYKTHFVIVDAVGAVKSKKTDSRPLERKPSIPLKDLLGAVTMGVVEEDLFLSLSNRLLRLDKQLSAKEKERVKELANGKDLLQISRELLSAFDPDLVEQGAEKRMAEIPRTEHTPDMWEEARKQEREALGRIAGDTFNGELNNYLDHIRREHEQRIDHINLDTVTHSDWDRSALEQARAHVQDFRDYLEAHKDEIAALSIFYKQPYRRREVTFRMIRELMDKLQQDKPALSPAFVWNAWSAIDAEDAQVPRSESPKDELTALISLVRRACGIDGQLIPFDKTIDENFKKWIFRRNAGNAERFSPEQMEWLRMIRDHIKSSYHIEAEDLDYTPFDGNGGRGMMYRLFGDQMQAIMDEINEALAA